MKANELMIGDWATVHHPTMPAKIIQISADWLITIERINNGHIKEDSPLFRIVEPIPLTVEILEKNGWRGKSHTQWQFFRDGCDELNILLGKDYAEVEYLNMIYNPEDNAEVNYGHNFEFPRTIYVHELQHVLRLCGIEKEITL